MEHAKKAAENNPAAVLVVVASIEGGRKMEIKSGRLVNLSFRGLPVS